MYKPSQWARQMTCKYLARSIHAKLMECGTTDGQKDGHYGI